MAGVMGVMVVINRDVMVAVAEVGLVAILVTGVPVAAQVLAGMVLAEAVEEEVLKLLATKILLEEGVLVS
jgi:hypothetical protein